MKNKQTNEPKIMAIYSFMKSREGEWFSRNQLKDELRGDVSYTAIINNWGAIKQFKGISIGIREYRGQEIETLQYSPRCMDTPRVGTDRHFEIRRVLIKKEKKTINMPTTPKLKRFGWSDVVRYLPLYCKGG